MAQDYNINVRLSDFRSGSKTSVLTSTEKMQYKTSSGNKNISFGGLSSSKFKGMNRLLKTGAVIGVASLAKKKLVKSAHRVNDTFGTISNNRYRQKRNKQTIDGMANPVSMGNEMLQYTAQRHFEVLRENKGIDRQRRLSGNAIPYHKSDGGLSI